MAMNKEYKVRCEMNAIITDAVAVTDMLLKDCDKYTREKFTKRYKKEIADLKQELKACRMIEAVYYGEDPEDIKEPTLSRRDLFMCLWIASKSLKRTTDKKISSHDRDILKEIAQYLNEEYGKYVDLEYN